jgi:hypothetical protein
MGLVLLKALVGVRGHLALAPPLAWASRRKTVEYLIRKRGTGRAHLWMGTDTLCRMASTGGLRPHRYTLNSSHCMLPVCQMCRNVAEREGILWRGVSMDVEAGQRTMTL